MIKAGILWLLFLSSWSRGKVGRRGSLDGALRCFVPSLLVQSLAQTKHVVFTSKPMLSQWEAEGSLGNQAKVSRLAVFTAVGRRKGELGGRAPHGRCLRMAGAWTWEAGAPRFSQVSCLTDWQGMPELWVQDGEWELLGECCLSWQLLLGLIEE